MRTAQEKTQHKSLHEKTYKKKKDLKTPGKSQHPVQGEPQGFQLGIEKIHRFIEAEEA